MHQHPTMSSPSSSSAPSSSVFGLSSAAPNVDLTLRTWVNAGMHEDDSRCGDTVTPFVWRGYSAVQKEPSAETETKIAQTAQADVRARNAFAPLFGKRAARDKGNREVWQHQILTAKRRFAGRWGVFPRAVWQTVAPSGRRSYRLADGTQICNWSRLLTDCPDGRVVTTPPRTARRAAIRDRDVFSRVSLLRSMIEKDDRKTAVRVRTPLLVCLAQTATSSSCDSSCEPTRQVR